MENPYNPVASQNTLNPKHSVELTPARTGSSKGLPWVARFWASMLRLILLQLATTVAAGAIAGMLGGMHAMFSALLGGLCCVVPNALFAVRLFANAKKGEGANPMSFFIGEFIKIALTVALLGAVAWLYRDLNWLALIAGFVVALKSYIILLFRH